MNHTVYHPGGMRPRCGAMPVPRMESSVTAEPCDRTPEPVCGGCGDLAGRALAMAYVPNQQFGEVYEPCAALIAGTLFPDLDKPFCGMTISASAYPHAPARTCGGASCACTRPPMTRGGVRHD